VDEVLALVMLIHFGWMPWLWDQSAQTVLMLLPGSVVDDHVIVHSLVFTVGIYAMETVSGVVSVPSISSCFFVSSGSSASLLACTHRMRQHVTLPPG
jgi:hypothetical protein